MRIPGNNKPRASQRGRTSLNGGTSRLGAEMRVVPKNYIDPIEYAQKALRHEYAVRLAQYQRQKGVR